MRKSLKTILLALGLSAALVACSGGNDATEATTTEAGAATTTEAVKETEKQELTFISTDDTKAVVDSGDTSKYVLIDLRKAADYESGHVDGFTNADVDNAKENGDVADGAAKLEAAIKEQTGGEDLGDREILLMCYSGAGYAQVGTDILVNEMGVDPAQIKTIEGGMKAW